MRFKTISIVTLVFMFVASVTVWAKPDKTVSSQPEVSFTPEAARGPAIDPDKGYVLKEIKDGLYWVSNGVYDHMFLVTGEGVIVVDMPHGLGKMTLNAIQQVTDEPITHLVYSHSHDDHIGEAGLIPEGVIIIAHQETKVQLARAKDPNRPVPTVTFEKSHTLKFGDQTLELAYKGNNHEPGNILIHAPRQKVLMMVDVIYPGWSPYMWLAQSEDIPGWILAHDQILEYDFDVFIGGHVNRYGSRKDVEIQREYIQDIMKNARQAWQMYDYGSMYQAVLSKSDNPWMGINIYIDTMARACNELTLPKWIDRLGGVETYTFGHCKKMLQNFNMK